MAAGTIDIRIAVSAVDIEAVRGLFTEYAHSLGFSLCFQGFDRELAELPGAYAPPKGCLRLATLNSAAVGCVAVRPHAGDICEMKRLYVKPKQRRSGLGRRLVEIILDDARRAGYRSMRLDTLSSMTAAIALYKTFGFREIPPYYDNPIASAVYLECELGVAAS